MLAAHGCLRKQLKAVSPNSWAQVYCTASEITGPVMRVSLLLFTLCLLVACGQKGPLFLPDKNMGEQNLPGEESLPEQPAADGTGKKETLNNLTSP